MAGKKVISPDYSRIVDGEAVPLYVDERDAGPKSKSYSGPVPFVKEAVRKTLMAGARGAEGIVGLPGDIVDVGRALSGLKTKRTFLPTSEDIRENVTKNLTGKYLEPKSATDRYIGNIAGETASWAMPFSAVGKGALAAAKGAKAIRGLSVAEKFAKNLGRGAIVSIAGNAAGDLAKGFVGPVGQGVVKLGTMLATGGIGRPGRMKKYIDSLYKEVPSTKKAFVSAPELKAWIKTQKNAMEKGLKTPSSSIRRRTLDQLKSKFTGKSIPELQEFVDKKISRLSSTATQSPTAIRKVNFLEALEDKLGSSKTTPKKVLEWIERESRNIGREGKEVGDGAMSRLLGQIKKELNVGTRINVEELIESKKSINEIISQLPKDLIKGTARTRTSQQLRNAVGNINKEIMRYGKKNPEFLKPWRLAEKAFEINAKSQQVGRLLQGAFSRGARPKSLHGIGTLGLLNASLGGSLAKLAVPVTGGYKIGQVLYRMANSPALTKYYLNIIKNVAANNIPAAIRSFQRLDKLAKKQEIYKRLK